MTTETVCFIKHKLKTTVLYRFLIEQDKECL